MCCRISKLRLHPRIRGLQGLGRPGAAASTHMCVSEKTPFIQGCTQGSKAVWDWPTDCCCEHTHVCVAESHVNSRLAPRIKKVQELGRPNFAATRCCCEKKPHSFKVAPKDQRLYGVGRRTAAVSIHMCVWQNHMSTQGLHQGSKRYKSLADQLLLRAYTYVYQKQFQVAPKDHRLHGTGRPPARICKVKAAPKGQGLQVFGRLCVAVSIHMCVAEYINSGLHPGSTCYKGSADQVLLRAYTYALQNISVQRCTHGSKDHLQL